MQIRIESTDLPGRCGPSPDRPEGHHNIHVGVQSKRRPYELLGVVAAVSASARWTFDARAIETTVGIDVNGPYIHGRPGSRFIYLNWGVIDNDETFMTFRRAKLMFDGIPTAVLTDATKQGVLVGGLGLTDDRGNPLCAAVRPPLIKWSASSER